MAINSPIADLMSCWEKAFNDIPTMNGVIEKAKYNFLTNLWYNINNDHPKAVL